MLKIMGEQRKSKIKKGRQRRNLNEKTALQAGPTIMSWLPEESFIES